MASKRKQDEKHLNLLRGMAKLDHNKQCIDCNQRGPTYLNMTIGAFVCTSCSGLLRGLNPPHRVKSISMASFTPEEIDFVRSRGNEFCRKVWLGLHDRRNIDFLDKDENKIKDFMVLKYEKKRYYVAPTEAWMEEARQQNTPPKAEPAAKPLRSLGNIPSLSVQPGQSAANRPVSSSSQPAANSSAAAAAVTSTSTQPVSRPIAHPPPAGGAQLPAATVAAAAARKTTGMNLLDELGGDPFTASQQQNQQGFANFEAFGSQQPQMPHSMSQPTGFPPTNAMGSGMMSPMSSTPQQPAAVGGGGSVVTPGGAGAVVQSNSFGAFSMTSSSGPAPMSTGQQQPAPSGGDRYSALAELDSVFGGGSGGQKNVNWDGTAGGGGSGGGSVFGGSSNATGSGGVFGGNASSNSPAFNTAANPFGGGTPPTRIASANEQPKNPGVNTGSAANPFASSGFNQSATGGFGQPMNTATSSHNRGGGGGFNSVSSPFATGGGQFGMTNGSMPMQQQSAAPQQQQQMWGMGGGQPQQQQAQGQMMNAFGSGAPPGMMQGKMQAVAGGQQIFPGQQQQQQQPVAGGWGGAAAGSAPQPVANPFMNIANQQANRPLNSTNPFL